MKPLLPPALKPGDTIGIMAPSTLTDRAALDTSADLLTKKGYKVQIHPQTGARHGHFAGTPQEKAAALHDLFRDPGIQAIMFARGGNGAGQMLRHLDYDLIARHPKIILGFSDITALLLAINKETGLTTFHGPVLHRLGKTSTDAQLDQCLNMLSGGQSLPLSQGTVLNPGKAAGPLIGGNLSLFCSLLGTPWQPDTNRIVLFLEDCADEFTRLDRYFSQLQNAGIFDNIAGLVIGGFTDLKDTGSVPFGFTIEERVAEYTAGLNIPVIANVSFGHGGDLYTFPVGAPVSLAADNKGVKLEIAGPVVARDDTGRAPGPVPYHSR